MPTLALNLAATKESITSLKMRLLEWVIPFLALTSVVEAQGIKVGKILKKKPGLARATNPKKVPVKTKAIASRIVTSLRKHKPKATPAPVARFGGGSARIQAVNTCAKQDIWFNYVLPVAKDPVAFLTDSFLANLAKGQVNYPPGYTLAFSDQYASLNADRYITFTQLPSMNATACAAFCDSVDDCKAFNIYFERTPSLDPGPNCPNPAAASSVYCTLWGAPINVSQLSNGGEWRTNFMIVKQGSVGFNKVATPPKVDGFNAPQALAGAVDTTKSTLTGKFLGAQFYAQSFNPQLCADFCTTTTANNKKTGLLGKLLQFQPCNYFNVLDISLNGKSQGTYCQLYNTDVVASASGLYSFMQNAASFDLQRSFGYALSEPDDGTLPEQFTYTTTSVNSGTATTIATATIAPTTAGAPTTIQLTYPTAVKTCSNTGVRYAGYTNPYTASNILSSFDPTYFKKRTPSFTGTTSYIGQSTSANLLTSLFTTVYGTSRLLTNGAIVLDHVFYVFANQDGIFNFTIPSADDIELVWIGDAALSGFTRKNADLEQLNGATGPVTKGVQASLGEYIPVRVQWGNVGADGELRLDVTAPDGSVVHQTTEGKSSATVGPNLVQFPCDSSLGGQFAAWGRQT